MKNSKELPTPEEIQEVARQATQVATEVANASHARAESAASHSGQAWLMLRLDIRSKLGRHLLSLSLPELRFERSSSPGALQMHLPHFTPPGTRQALTPQEEGLREAAKVFEDQLGWTVLTSSRFV